jgi:hypothetical protein
MIRKSDTMKNAKELRDLEFLALGRLNYIWMLLRKSSCILIALSYDLDVVGGYPGKYIM